MRTAPPRSVFALPDDLDEDFVEVEPASTFQASMLPPPPPALAHV